MTTKWKFKGYMNQLQCSTTRKETHYQLIKHKGKEQRVRHSVVYIKTALFIIVTGTHKHWRKNKQKIQCCSNKHAAGPETMLFIMKLVGKNIVFSSFWVLLRDLFIGLRLFHCTKHRFLTILVSIQHTWELVCLKLCWGGQTSKQKSNDKHSRKYTPLSLSSTVIILGDPISSVITLTGTAHVETKGCIGATVLFTSSGVCWLRGCHKLIMPLNYHCKRKESAPSEMGISLLLFLIISYSWRSQSYCFA